MGISRREIEEGETPQEALKRETIHRKVKSWVIILYSVNQLSHLDFCIQFLHGFWAEVITGHLVLKEAEAAKWLTKKQLDSVAWLPADVTLIDKIRACMK